MNLDVEKKWLVKSDNKIVGPYSFEQLEDLLFKRQVSLIDEIRDMSRRWQYIREIPELKDMVEKVRIELDKRSEQTRTLQSPSLTNSGTLTQSSRLEIAHTDFTKNVPQFTDVSVDSQDIEFKEIEIKPIEFEKKKNIPKFVSSADPAVRSELSDNRTKILALLSVVFLVTIVFMGAFYFYKKINQEKFEKSLMTKVRKHMINGADAKAVAVFQKLSDQLQNKILPDILPLFPRLDAEGLIQMDEALMQVQKNSKLDQARKAQIELIYFNKNLQLNNLVAAKANLIQAKDLDPDSDIVKENEAIFAYIENQNKQSSKQYLNLFNQHNKGRYLFGYSLNNLKANDISDVQLIEKIDRYLSTRVEYKKELLLIQIILAARINNLKIIDVFKTDFVNTPIQLSQNFKLPYLVYQLNYKFEKINPEYEKIKSQIPQKLIAVIDLYLSLEKGDGYAAQKNYDQIQDQLNKAEKANAQIAINSILNRFSENVAIEKTVAIENLNTSSHLALMKSKIDNKSIDFLKNADILRKEKNIVSFWANLLMIDKSDSLKLRSFLQNNATGVEDFIPFIEAREDLD